MQEILVKISKKTCPICHMPAYSIILGETGKILDYCQNPICINMGTQIQDNSHV